MCISTTLETVDVASGARRFTVQETKPQLKRRQTVTFNETRSVKTVASLTDLPDETQDELWYRSCDIERFRQKARRMCREIRRRRMAHHQSIRGLEFRADAERQHRVDVVIRFVVGAQGRYSDPRTLAHIYRRCSAWTVIAAALVARRDFFAAYDIPSKDNPTLPSMETYPLPFRKRSEKKRPSSTSEIPSSPADAQRRVRQKIATSGAQINQQD